MSNPFAIVVGAGPCGLLLTLLLAKAGFEVRLLDAGETVDDRPRATHYGPGAVQELERAGVLPDILERGFIPDGVSWRRIDGSTLAQILSPQLKGDAKHQVVCLPLDQLGILLHEHLQRQSKAQILWKHSVTGIHQGDGEVSVDVETPDGKARMSASYVIGCDGANSQIRRSLFGDLNFPGWTWDEQIIATNTYYPFEKFGFIDANLIVDRENWARYMAARMSEDGLWRVTYGDVGGLTRDQYLERQASKFEKMLPGHPTADKWKTINFSPYKVHQRLAESMRVGRVLLAGDAAHLCNPFGGLGLTGGIADVGGLYDCLVGIATGRADDSILDRYSAVRSQIYREFTDPVSTANMRRMCQTDPQTAADDPVLQMMNKGNTDPVTAAKMAAHLHSISHDFTQYYHQPGGVANGAGEH